MLKKYNILFLPELTALITALGIVYFLHLNQILFCAINAVADFTGTFLWANLTILGDAMVASVIVFIFIKRNPQLVWTALVALVLSVIIVTTLKPLLAVARPPVVFDNSLINIIGPARSDHAFPSGHTASIFTLAGALMIYTRYNWQRAGLFLFALLVGLARIAVGVHWPLDVLAGAALGLVSAACAYRIVCRLKWGANRTAQLIWGGIFIIATLALLFVYDTHYQEAIWLQRIIATVVLIVGGIDYGRLVVEKHLKAGKT